MKKEIKICKTFPLSHFNHNSKLKWLVDTYLDNGYTIHTFDRIRLPLLNKKGHPSTKSSTTTIHTTFSSETRDFKMNESQQ